jgi:hypothetical protein
MRFCISGRRCLGRHPPNRIDFSETRRPFDCEGSGLDVVADELVGVYSKPYKDNMELFIRAPVLGRNPWQPNGEISRSDHAWTINDCRSTTAQPPITGK